MGLEFSNPMATAFLDIQVNEYKPTWAERKFKELVWKLKVRKARWNTLFYVIAMIFSIALILAFIIALSVWFSFPAMGIFYGLLGAELIIGAGLFWLAVFTLNADYVRPKHKGKTYY